MYRRALLAALPAAVAGCSVAPSGPSTDAYPATAPNIFVSFEWAADRSELIVEFTRGNQLTPENTGSLTIETFTDDLNQTVWIASDQASVTGDPVADFPLSPGATVAHQMSEPAQTRVVWTASDRNRSRAVRMWSPENETTATATPTEQTSGARSE